MRPWSRSRGILNVTLVAALIAAVGATSLVGGSCRTDGDVEVTLFTLGFQAIALLFVFGTANFALSFAKWAERFVPSATIDRYRRFAFVMLIGAAATLPFALPLFLSLGPCAPRP